MKCHNGILTHKLMTVSSNRDADNYIYSVGQGTSPDLQLAIEKATMIAKAVLLTS